MIESLVSGTQPVRILLVEDNAGDARLLRVALQETRAPGFQITHVGRLEDATSCLLSGQFDLVLLDLSLPDSDGLDTVTRVCDLARHTPIVVLTSLEDEALAIKAVRQGAQDYLIKGQTETPLLLRAIRYAIERKHAQEERERLVGELEDALATIEKISGHLPVCTSCNRVLDKKGGWKTLEQFAEDHPKANVRPGICADCGKKLHPEYFIDY